MNVVCVRKSRRLSDLQELKKSLGRLNKNKFNLNLNIDHGLMEPQSTNHFSD